MKHSRPEPLEPVVIHNVPLTFATVMSRIEASPTLSDQRRRDMISGLRRVAAAIGHDPSEARADPEWLRARIYRVKPAALGVTDKTWQNAVSDTRSALAHVGVVRRRIRSTDDLCSPWRDLWREVLASGDKSIRISLGRFLHFLSDRHVRPEDVTQSHARAFCEALMSEEIAKPPEWAWRNAVWGWNRAITRIPGWPQTALTLPPRRQVITLADASLPVAFLSDLEEVKQRSATIDPFAEVDTGRPLRPSTTRHHTAMLKRFASELILAGVPPEQVGSVATLCDPAHAELGLRAMVARNGGKSNSVIADTSMALCGYARRLNLGEEVIHRLAILAKRLALPMRRGMTQKNRERLRPLQDRHTLRRLLDLPDQLFRKAGNLSPARAALAREDALAIAILLVCPLRVGNLAGLHIERDIQRPGNGKVFVSLREEQVKNSRPIEFELPADVRKMLDKHLASRVPLRCPVGTPWLFPRKDGLGPVDRPAFSARLTKRIRKEIGLDINPHLFRHLVAMIWLTANPGSYEAARRLLGHSTVSTTIDFYAGLETTAAMQAFGEIIAEKRSRP